MNVDIAYLKIKRALESDSECFLCVLEEEIERKFIDTYLYELVMDVSSREKIIETRGFCNYHFYKMLVAASRPESPDGHGMALILEDITERLIQDIRNRKNVYKMLANENKCPLCFHLYDFMEIYIESVVKLLSSKHEEFSTLFKESKGVCIPHFVALIQVAEENAREKCPCVIEIMTDVEEKNLLKVNAELAEFIRRQSYEFSEKDRDAVKDVVSRSVRKITGRHGTKPILPQKTRKVLFSK